MTEVFNIDELATKPRLTIVVGGVRHEMKPMTVQTFIDNVTDFDKARTKTETSPVEDVEMAVRIVARSFPSLAEAEIRALDFGQLAKLRDLIYSTGNPDAENDQKEQEGNAPAAS